jgi:hypothetical protein
MAFVAGAIIGKIGLDTSGLSGGIGTAVSLAASAGPALAAPFLAAFHLIEEAGKKAFDFVIDSIESVGHHFDDMGEAAERAGVSTQFLSTVGIAAKDSGGSIEELGHAMTILARNAADAAEGNKDAIKSFAKVGLSQGDVAGSLDDMEGLFKLVVSGIGEIDEKALKTKSTFDLFGRGGTTLTPLINQGNEGIQMMIDLMVRLGANVTAEDAKAGDAFGTLSTLIGAAWQGVQNELARPVLNYILAHKDEVIGFIIEASDLLKTALPPLLQGVAFGIDVIIQSAEKALAVLQPLAAISDKLGLTQGAEKAVFEGRVLGQGAETMVVNLRAHLNADDTADKIAKKIKPQIDQQRNIFEQKLGARVANGRAAGGLGGRAAGGSDFGSDFGGSDFGPDSGASSPGGDYGGSSSDF